MNPLIEAALSYDGPQLSFMEVCGTHTMAIARHGLKSLLSPRIRLISGPGCPVCVTDAADIDAVLTLLEERPEITLTTFGDMLRVPGTRRRSLERLRAEGADVRVVYSVTGALELARQMPEREVVFLGVGFETTAPGTAAALSEAVSTNVDNFRVISLHKLVPPALRQLLTTPGAAIDGFILPGHVSIITGTEPYEFLAAQFRVGGVVAGFEPADILTAVGMLLAQRQAGAPAVEIQYRRFVAPAGNRPAQAALAEVFSAGESAWRGLGVIPDSGLIPRADYASHVISLDRSPQDAAVANAGDSPAGCRCGDILRGLIAPPECPLFGSACTPRDPVGPCMVSSEGACAASFRYRGVDA
ncbi:MAG: hydrogenase formation protein HypD [Chloroflexota bacterium]